jgi:hypothetical protein
MAPPPPVDRGSTPTRSAAIARLSSEIEAAQRELDMAGSNCTAACRALASMDRAAGHLCELALGGDEIRRCEDAKDRVRAARDRVRAACGRCERGPSVDRNAPIPSRP